VTRMRLLIVVDVPHNFPMQRGLLSVTRLVRPLACHITRVSQSFRRIRPPIWINFHKFSSAAMSYSIIERGSPNTLEYRLFFCKCGFVDIRRFVCRTQYPGDIMVCCIGYKSCYIRYILYGFNNNLMT